VQLKHFFKKQSIKHILCFQSNNGAAFVPNSETSFAKAGKFTLLSLSVLAVRKFPAAPTRV
jgi:hypothetical protein